MNETLFKQIVEKDLDNLNSLISKGYFETSDFESAISKLAILLTFLSQALGE